MDSETIIVWPWVERVQGDPQQLLIHTHEMVVFQSYTKRIAVMMKDTNDILLDDRANEYSETSTMFLKAVLTKHWGFDKVPPWNRFLRTDLN